VDCWRRSVPPLQIEAGDLIASSEGCVYGGITVTRRHKFLAIALTAIVMTALTVLLKDSSYSVGLAVLLYEGLRPSKD
jgi:hypothetical protein